LSIIFTFTALNGPIVEQQTLQLTCTVSTKRKKMLPQQHLV